MSNVLAKSNIKDVAREALRALVIRKLDPSPDNYRRLFNEIAGIEETGGSSSGAEDALARIAHDFPRSSPELLRVAKAMERAAAKREWSHLAVLLHEASEGLTRYYASAESWRALLSELLQQFDAPHKGLSHARKKERLERLLEIPATTPEHLQHKLAAIVRNWGELSTDAEAVDPHEPELAHAPEIRRIAVSHHPDALLDEPLMLCELLAHVLEIGMAGLLAYDPPMAQEAEALAKQARGARSAPEVQSVRSATKSFLLRVELTTANTSDLHQGILRLLRLVVENVAALVGEDDWLHGQIAVLAEIVSRPLDLGMIQHAERSIKDAILRQGTLRLSLAEAKTAFKSMVSSFIDRLGEFSMSAGDYHETVERLSTQIRQTDDIVELGRLLEEVAAATRLVQAATLRSREETLRTQQAVQDAEQKIRDLQTELTRVSAKVREDQLTGALNRRGLEEEFDRACSACERRREPMSLALLDMDDFKRVNDVHGHMAGDNALVHLANVIRSTVRPTDVVCRYGGEEFVILLPGTGLRHSVGVVSRLQRELTKRFFLHDNQRLLLTFSAGVAERRDGETREQMIARADAAMYLAKRAGKNRVMVAE